MDIEVLLPYQKKWINDESTVKVWVKSRRIGASWAEALASVLEAAKSKEAGGQSTYYLSYAKEMTQQFAHDCAFWAKHLHAAASLMEEVVLQDEDKDITVYRIRFASGFEIWCLPSVARALRSKQGRVVIDEAAFIDDLPGVLKAAMALTMWGGTVRILSSYNGDDNPFYELVQDIKAGRHNYALYETTLDEALKQGLYKQICLVRKQEWSQKRQNKWKETLIADYGDAADEELFCIPLRAGTRYFPAAMLEAVSDPSVKVIRKACADAFTFEKKERRVKEFDAWLKHEVRDLLKSIENPVYLGEDFARSGDLTCIFLDEQMPSGDLRTFCVIELRNVPFDQQWQTIKYLMENIPRFAGGAFDSRGNGQMIAELAAQEWPGFIHQVMITAGWYAENFPKLKERMEDGETNIPDDIFVREDFRQVGIKAGVPRVLERSGGPRERRHGDGAIAKLMALYAFLEDEEQGYHEYKYESVKSDNRYRGRSNTWDQP